MPRSGDGLQHRDDEQLERLLGADQTDRAIRTEFTEPQEAMGLACGYALWMVSPDPTVLRSGFGRRDQVIKGR